VGQSGTEPSFQIVFLFHENLELFQRTFSACTKALTATNESYEIVIYCDGTPPDVALRLTAVANEWDCDELRFRRRGRFVASGAPGNNAHRRLFSTRAPYLIVIEDDVVLYADDKSFDILAAARELFERHAEVSTISKMDDSDQWVWQLEDVGDELETGVRSVNRVATHFLIYDVRRFASVAARFGAFEADVFVDRNDLSYNWEDLVSHVGTTGGRRIAFPECWPMSAFHCDRKVEPGSIYHTQDPAVRLAVFEEIQARRDLNR
jgi:hypothetical protein